MGVSRSKSFLCFTYVLLRHFLEPILVRDKRFCLLRYTRDIHKKNNVFNNFFGENTCHLSLVIYMYQLFFVKATLGRGLVTWIADLWLLVGQAIIDIDLAAPLIYVASIVYMLRTDIRLGPF